MASEAATRRVGVLAQQLAPEIGLQRNTTSGQSTSYASIGGQPSSYARVHGDVSREPAVWRDIVVVGKEQLKEVLYAKAEGIAKITINRPEKRNAFTPRTGKPTATPLSENSMCQQCCAVA
ncbi:uncharacterized protein HaLaN_06705 [Haematococcus lacustris]|uniref:Uncharacterized protein n=1 Tax=Haematococcus lacustris TaxID=44745 RepID=A0A699YW04_HAELA|nr:uncharacterized protein HaLaN_06705 [Haematococcus lacustris]